MESKIYYLRIKHVFDHGFTIAEICDRGAPDYVEYEYMACSTLRTDSRRGSLGRKILAEMLGKGFATEVKFREHASS